MTTYNAIAESDSFIVLNHYTKHSATHEPPRQYQSEADLEMELIQDLIHQGYEYRQDITTPKAMLANARQLIEALNEIKFTDSEWTRYQQEYLCSPSDNLVDKSRKVHDNYICDFTFDDGHLENIYLFDKRHIARNRVQVISQFEQSGVHSNRYDVSILVNGLPLVHVELKARGVAIQEAFNQVHRYSKESFNSDSSLYKYVQMFVISNGTDSRYFANTLKRNKQSYDFTMNWAKADNTLIKDLKDFTATFFQKQTLLNVLLTYSVFDVSNTLLIMRPYQIAATERLIWKIKSAYESKAWSTIEAGGYIWHTTGSGKTLTSFKAARLATQLDFIDKVFFVVDRKDLDTQTMTEYQKYSPDSVNGSESTAELKRNIERQDHKIIVTTLQKLNNLMRSERDLPIYQKQVVFIFDECHRSQFGEAQKNLKRKFKKYYQFGFTGTPIFTENAIGTDTTQSVFGRELHSYVITDAIRDEKVLKFKVTYNDVRPKFRDLEMELDLTKLSAAENNRALLHPERIREISRYILDNYRLKTHRTMGDDRGFNAMLAVNSVEAAKLYYQELNRLQEGSERPLKIATIFSYAANEAQDAIGEIAEEGFEVDAMNSSGKEFLAKAIGDYNAMFGCNYTVDSRGFQDYYTNLAKRVKSREVDLLIVVGMFLTGFDAPTLNTLFVDKNLRYHGLMQAYSRTNRILNATKTFGNIVTFRDLEQATIDAITLFGDKNTRNVVLEKSYEEYLNGFTDIVTGRANRGYIEVLRELKEHFPDPSEIQQEQDKRDFAKLFGEYLRIENILQNYDEYTHLKRIKAIDPADLEAIEAYKQANYLTDEQVERMQHLEVLDDRKVQDYRSTYNDIRQWRKKESEGQQPEESKIEWGDVVFEVDLLKSQEINLDYILALVFEKNKETHTKEELIEDVRRVIRASMGNRAKESLIIDYIHATDLDNIGDKAGVIDSFFKYAQKRQNEEAMALIAEEGLNVEEAKRYITTSLRHEYATEHGTDLNATLPKMSPLNPQFRTKKKQVFERISAFVEKYKGIGGQIG